MYDIIIIKQYAGIKIKYYSQNLIKTLFLIRKFANHEIAIKKEVRNDTRI